MDKRKYFFALVMLLNLAIGTKTKLLYTIFKDTFF